MHRRLRHSSALVATALAGGVLLSPKDAQAGKYDLDLTPLGPNPGRDGEFRSLASELGTITAPRPMDPADSLGLSGFAVSGDVTINTLGGDRSYWRSTTSGRAGNVAPSLQVIGRKGLWPGLELGGGATHLFDSRMWALTGYFKFAIHEGFHHLPIPSIAIRASFSRLLGAKDINLTTAAPAVTISHVFGVGKTFSLTPYIGYEALLILASSRVVDGTPGCDETVDPDCQGPAGVDPEFVLKNAGVILRHRPHLGLRMIFSVMRLGFEAMFVPPGGLAGSLDGSSIEDDSQFQQQYTFSVGLDF